MDSLKNNALINDLTENCNITSDEASTFITTLLQNETYDKTFRQGLITRYNHFLKTNKEINRKTPIIEFARFLTKNRQDESIKQIILSLTETKPYDFELLVLSLRKLIYLRDIKYYPETTSKTEFDIFNEDNFNDIKKEATFIINSDLIKQIMDVIVRCGVYPTDFVFKNFNPIIFEELTLDEIINYYIEAIPSKQSQISSLRNINGFYISYDSGNIVTIIPEEAYQDRMPEMGKKR